MSKSLTEIKKVAQEQKPENTVSALTDTDRTAVKY